IRTPNIHVIRYLNSCLKGQWHRAFEKMHDNLLQILEIETQLVALEALVQYYDPLARCFTFRDFQLAPTLEEYECLLGISTILPPKSVVLLSCDSQVAQNFSGGNDQDQEEIEWVRRPSQNIFRGATGSASRKGRLACSHGRPRAIGVRNPTIPPSKGSR
ncbi:hypothetical protein CR513_16408, partial [Mucuna pruriens]